MSSLTFFLPRFQQLLNFPQIPQSDSLVPKPRREEFLMCSRSILSAFFDLLPLDFANRRTAFGLLKTLALKLIFLVTACFFKFYFILHRQAFSRKGKKSNLLRFLSDSCWILQNSRYGIINDWLYETSFETLPLFSGRWETFSSCTLSST